MILRPSSLLRTVSPALLLLAAPVSAYQVLDEYKISATDGGFVGPLAPFDNFGAAIANLGDLDGDGVPDLAVGARTDDDGGPDRGAVYVLFMNTDHTVKAETKISAIGGGFTGVLDDADRFGHALCTLSDLDGDGRNELAVGAPLDDDGGSNRGAVWILFLEADGTVRQHQKISATDGGLVGPLSDLDKFGWSLCPYADLDGDGVDDMLVGAPTDDQAAVDAGAVWFLYLNADGTVKDQHKFTEVNEPGAQFGSALGYLGQLDGNAAHDIAVGVRRFDDGGTDKGMVMIGFLGLGLGLNLFETVNDTFSAALTLEDGDEFGRSVVALGPAQGFVKQYLAVGADGEDDGGVDRGGLWVLELDGSGLVQSAFAVSSTAGGLLGPLDDGDQFGVSLAPLGDLLGDGGVALAVGADRDDDGGLDRGAVWILELCMSTATATFRNDAGGVNPTGYVAAPPVLGGDFTASVDNTSTVNTFAFVVGFGSPAEVGTAYGFILVNAADPSGEVLSLPIQAGTGVVNFTLPIPPELSFCGVALATQGASFGGGSVNLRNAYDLVLGR